MNVTIKPGKLRGKVNAIASKSYAHRILIAAALSDAPTRINLNTTSEDIEATKSCIKQLGAEIEEGDGYITVTPIKSDNIPKEPVLDCCESGSTARFMLPVSSAVCNSFSMTGRGRLPERPFTPLIEQMREKGVEISSDTLPLECRGTLTGGEYKIAGNISSQYITGLLMALPMCATQSTVTLTSELESGAYIDITLAVLEQFGVMIEKTENGYKIPPSRYTSPGEITVEGDWSNAAFWVVADEISKNVTVEGMNYDSIQGDRKILEVLKSDVIDAKEIPDLVPVLAVCACAKTTVTTIKNAQRLRLKESDRLRAVTESLNALGADIKELPDGLVINGKGSLCGGTCDGFNDHRIVMSASIAAAICTSEVTITGAQAVNKSYPAFFDDLQSLGAEVTIW